MQRFEEQIQVHQKQHNDFTAKIAETQKVIDEAQASILVNTAKLLVMHQVQEVNHRVLQGYTFLNVQDNDERMRMLKSDLAYLDELSGRLQQYQTQETQNV